MTWEGSEREGGGARGNSKKIGHLVLLSTACPTSLASDQTKGGGRPGVQRTPRFGAREQRFDLTKIQLSSKLSGNGLQPTTVAGRIY